MDLGIKLSSVLREVKNSNSRQESVIIKPFIGSKYSDKFIHHFLVFMKPELTSIENEVNVDEAINLILECFKYFGAEIGGIRAISSKLVIHEQLIEKNYFLLNQISKFGLEACSASVLTRLQNITVPEVWEQIKVLGGFQFLDNYPKFNAYSLCALIDNVGSKKIGSNIYATFLELMGEQLLVLNGFHPFQYEWLTHSGSAIVAIEGFTNRSWKDIHHFLIGTIKPDMAQKGSIRREIFNARKKIGISQSNIAFNGVHVSPGPLEAMFQIVNFFDSQAKRILLSQTVFGKRLLLLGLDEETISVLEKNPYVPWQGNEQPIFELSEDMDGHFAEKIVNTTIVKSIIFSKHNL